MRLLPLTAALLSFTGITSSAYAQSLEQIENAPEEPAEEEEGPPDPSVAVMINPLGMPFGLFTGDLGVALSDSLSLQAIGLYRVTSGGETKATMAGGGAGLQIFVTDDVYRGVYIYPQVLYADVSSQAGSGAAKATAVGVGAFAGYQWLWSPFGVRLGAGVVYYAATADAGDERTTGQLLGVEPGLDLSAGFVF